MDAQINVEIAYASHDCMVEHFDCRSFLVRFNFLKQLRKRK